MLEHSESKAVFVEDAEQLAKVREVQGDLPNLEHIVIFDPVGRHRRRDHARRPARARRRPRRRRAGGAHRGGRPRTTSASPSTPRAPPARPRAACISHGNYRDVTSMTESMGVLQEGEVVYLFLPLAHAFAKLDPVRRARPRRRARLLGEGPPEDHPQPDGGQADLLPVRAAHVREDLHAGHHQRPGQGAARAGRAGRAEGAPAAGTPARRSRPSCRPASTRPRRRSTRTCAGSSAATSASA